MFRQSMDERDSRRKHRRGPLALSANARPRGLLDPCYRRRPSLRRRHSGSFRHQWQSDRPPKPHSTAPPVTCPLLQGDRRGLESAIGLPESVVGIGGMRSGGRWTVKLGPTVQANPAPRGRSGRSQCPSRPGSGKSIRQLPEDRSGLTAHHCNRHPRRYHCSLSVFVSGPIMNNLVVSGWPTTEVLARASGRCSQRRFVGWMCHAVAAVGPRKDAPQYEPRSPVGFPSRRPGLAAVDSRARDRRIPRGCPAPRARQCVQRLLRRSANHTVAVPLRQASQPTVRLGTSAGALRGRSRGVGCDAVIRVAGMCCVDGCATVRPASDAHPWAPGRAVPTPLPFRSRTALHP